LAFALCTSIALRCQLAAGEPWPCGAAAVNNTVETRTDSTDGPMLLIVICFVYYHPTARWIQLSRETVDSTVKRDIRKGEKNAAVAAR
jgi:hypothetical protein